MNIVGIENITPYEGVYEFNVYEYEGDIDLGNKDSFICDLKVILTKVQTPYIERINKSVQAIALVSNLNTKFDKSKVKDGIEELIFQEICDENLEKENIDIMFIES